MPRTWYVRIQFDPPEIQWHKIVNAKRVCIKSFLSINMGFYEIVVINFWRLGSEGVMPLDLSHRFSIRLIYNREPH